MSLPRLWIIAVRNTRAIRRHIRGQLAEQNDSELADALPTTNPPDPLPLRGVVRATWQRPVVSAPIPSLSGARLAMWGVWESLLSPEAQAMLDAREAAFPALIRTFKQQGSYDPNGNFVPSETIAAFKARVIGLLGWIDAPTTI